jgi:alpha-L-arabinofuranosidase
MDITARIDNVEGRVAGEVGVWEMNHPDLKAIHDFGNDQTVRPAKRTFAASVTNNGFSYTFPKHSLTILRLKLN